MYRSMLFCPGNHPRKVEKVFSAGADSVILDLEDAVAISEKEATRAVVVEALERPRACLAYVRVNDITTPFFHGDVFAVAGAKLDGIMLPKVESAEDLRIADWVIRQAEREAGIEEGSLDVIPIIETAKGVLNALEICKAVPRVKRVAFGAGDFTNDTNMTWTKHGRELLFARTQIVLASRAAEIEPPIDTVYIDLNDEEGFREDSIAGRELGFQGRMVIHPKNVPVANEVYSPTPEEIAWSMEVVEAFRKAEAEGSASIQIRGHFVDYPIVYQAERVVERARKLGLID